MILPGVRIGRGCTVGAGSVVTKVRTYVFLFIYVWCGVVLKEMFTDTVLGGSRMFRLFMLWLGIRRGFFVRLRRLWIRIRTRKEQVQVLHLSEVWNRTALLMSWVLLRQLLLRSER